MRRGKKKILPGGRPVFALIPKLFTLQPPPKKAIMMSAGKAHPYRGAAGLSDRLHGRGWEIGVPIISILEYIGVFAFSISGAYVAMEKRMDLFGAVVLAGVTAVGGGVMRDVIMNVGVPIFFSSYITIGLVLLATVSSAFFIGRFTGPWLLVFDAIGLSVFVAETGAKAIRAGYSFPEFLFVAVITGVGGGVLRDVLAQRVPLVLRKEVYASAALAGAVFLWFAHPPLGLTVSTYLAIAIIIALRLTCAFFKVNLPTLQVKRRPAARETVGARDEC